MRLGRLSATLAGSGLFAMLVGGCPGAPRAGVAGSPTDTENLSGPEAVVPDELIVATVPGADPGDLAALFSDQGVTVRDRLVALSVTLLGVDPARRAAARTGLEASPLVEGVTDNRIVAAEALPSDPLVTSQWHLAAVDAPAAWDITTGSEQILVAVLDSGVDETHIDLAPKLRPGGNTRDATAGWHDLHGHGTAVAGIIGAVADNQTGVASIAWKNPLMPIRVTDDQDHATTWSVAAGIALAAQAGAKVINVSVDSLENDLIVLRQAELARLAGSLVVIAAGNSGQAVVGGGSDAALFVGAVDQNDNLASFSTFGDFVDIVAPGVNIYTTQPGNRYGAWTGTSFAAPIVSGVAALVWSVNPSLRPTTVQGILLATATDLGPPGEDVQFGAGKVNARAAVELSRAIVEQPDTTPPTVAIDQPADGATVFGRIAVQVRVADDSDTADVTLVLDGTPLATDAISPYAFTLDTTRFALGPHTISAVATDVFGNSSERGVAITFGGAPDETPPVVAIVGPRDGETVYGVVTVLADASDDRLLGRAEVLVDDRLISTINIGSERERIACNWNTSAPDVAAGPHTITVRVVDSSGNTSSASVHISVGK